MHYNEKLADEQDVSQEDRVKLDETYERLFYALDHPELFGDVVKVVRDLEFELQGLWKFKQDEKYHRYQLEIKGCTCPKMDNYEFIGWTKSRYVASDCPIHWI